MNGQVWFNLTTSRAWDRPAVGIVRVEKSLFEALQKITPVRACAWRDNAFRALDSDDQPRAGDTLITLGLDWDHAYHQQFHALAKEGGIRLLTCVYDLIPILFPQFCVGDVALRFKDYLNQLLWSSSDILCISRHTERDLQDWAARIGAPAPRTTVIALGDSLPAGSGAVSDAVREALAQPFVLYVSTIERRKNHEILYRAWHLLARAGYAAPKLVLVGMPGWHVGDLLHDIAFDPFVAGQIVQLNQVSDAELALLYQRAAFCVYPSLYEGWGLPVGEALAFGKAVLASDQASIPEVGGELVRYASPWNAQAWADAVREWNDAPAAVKAIEQRVRAEYAPRSWEATAGSVLEVLANRARRPGTEASDAVEGVEALKASEAVEAEAMQTEAQALAIQGPGHGQPRQLFVDVTFLIRSDSHSGIQRVVRSILKEFLDTPPGDFTIEPVCMDEEGAYRYARGFEGRSDPAYNPSAAEKIQPQIGDLFFGLDLMITAAHHAETFRTLRQFGVEVVFVAYDLLPLSMPQHFWRESGQVFTEWLKTVAQADGVIAISRAVADEIAERLKTLDLPPRARPLKLGWFHLGADVDASIPTTGLPDNAAAILQAMQERPSFLMVGTLEPRKGHRQALEAFERLWDSGVQANLVIVGKRGWRVEALSRAIERNAELGKRLFWLPSASDEFLGQLYGQADCLLAASEGEGFGLPLIEAALHDLPILARDLPVFREVAGEHAAYFTAAEPGALADAVRGWLTQSRAGTAPRSSGMPRLTWKQSADQLRSMLAGGQWYRS